MSRGTTVKLPERVAEAIAMREQGMLLREIAAHFGVAIPTIDAWLHDPDGARMKARKDSYAVPCIDCGEPTSGSEGRRDEPRCQGCANRVAGAAAKLWTRAALILAIQEWAHEYGEPPAVADWNAVLCRAMNDEARALRYENSAAAGKCPCHNTPIRAFGSWNAAIEAAGFTPRASHGGGGNELRQRRLKARP